MDCGICCEVLNKSTRQEVISAGIRLLDTMLANLGNMLTWHLRQAVGFGPTNKYSALLFNDELSLPITLSSCGEKPEALGPFKATFDTKLM